MNRESGYKLGSKMLWICVHACTVLLPFEVVLVVSPKKGS